MMAINHILMTLILIRLLKLDHNEAFVAFLFGVMLDLDHLMGIPAYIGEYGWDAIYTMDSLLHNDVQWKSAMHSTEAFLIVSVISILFRMYIPILFWGVHVAMDWVQINYWNIVAWPEFVIMAVLFIIYIFIELRIYNYSIRPERRSPRNFILFMWMRFLAFLRDVFPLHRFWDGCKMMTRREICIKERFKKAFSGDRDRPRH